MNTMRRTDEGIELNADETNAIVWIFCMWRQLDKNRDFLKMLAHEQGVARMYCGAAGMIWKTLDRMIEAMTPHQKDKLKRTLATRSVQLVLKNDALKQMDNIRLLHDSELDMLVEFAMEGACSMCMKDAKEARKCRLRKVLVGIVPPTEHNKYRCEYQDVRTT